jgi:hypothetical protein
MRTPDDDRARARDRCALARSTAHADDGVVLRAMEREAGASGLPGAAQSPNRTAIDGATPGLLCPARSVRAERSRYGRQQWAY